MDIIYRLRLLGPIQVEQEDKPVRGFESRKSLALLAYLARHDESVSRSRLAGLFWGDKEEARGRRNLSRELSQLSARLPGCFQADYYTVQFQPPATVWVDTIAFEALMKSSRGAGEHGSRGENFSPASLHPGSAAQLAEAVALYRGQFMAGYYLDDCPEFETWLLSEQEAWQRQVTEVLDQLINYHARQQANDQALAYARRWLSLEPWQEQAHRYLMLLLARTGQRSAALTQYEICRRVLAEELAAEPSAETVTLYEQIRADKLPDLVTRPVGQAAGSPLQSVSLPPQPISTPVAPPINIPIPSTPIIDREEERSQIGARLADPACRLLTLTGSGGIGKTRLAIQATLEAAANLPDREVEDGIYFIALDPLSSPDFLVSTIADAINFSFYSGVDPAGQLLNYLREKRMLLTLDNFEHLMEGTTLVADILKHAPHVKILAVSQGRLNLQEEWTLPLQGLSAPPAAPSPLPTGPTGVDGEAVENYSAVQLFVQRAQAVQPGYTLADADKPDVVRICQLVEGIPLAIELAAAWVRLFSCREIVQQIERNLDFLATSLRNVPERQRSLRAVFDHSWRLLSAEEQRVYRQLSVFRGGFERETAEHVVRASLPILLALLDKSLLRRTETGRYLRHMLLWQYAAEKLAETPPEQRQAQDRHCSYYATFLQQRTAWLKGGRQQETLAEIGIDIENIRRCWRWAIAQRNITAIERALESLFHFYDMRSWFQEGTEAFEWAAVILAEDAPSSPGSAPVTEKDETKFKIVLGKLKARRGWFTFQLGQPGPAKVLLQEGLTLLRGVGPAGRSELVFPLNYLGAVYRHLGEFSLAREHLLESLVVCQEVGDQTGLSIALTILSQMAYLEGDYSQARQLGQESLVIKQEMGDRWGMSFSLNTLGQVAEALTEYDHARELLQESLAICHEIGDRRGIALVYSYLGDIAQKQQANQEAVKLYRESLAIFKEIGNQLGLISAQTKLGQLFLARGTYSTAAEHFIEALKLALDIQAVGAAWDALAGLAAVLIKGGEAEQKQALEILTLLLNHPSSTSEQRKVAAQLLAELEPQIPAEVVKTAHRRGRISTVEVLVKRLVGERRS